jgi:hypothetical protein
MAATWQAAMIVIDARFEDAHAVIACTPYVQALPSPNPLPARGEGERKTQALRRYSPSPPKGERVGVRGPYVFGSVTPCWP